MKKMNSTNFQGLENQKNFGKLLTKKEEEEVQRDSKINVEKIACGVEVREYNKRGN